VKGFLKYTVGGLPFTTRFSITRGLKERKYRFETELTVVIIYVLL
jgi:hypothetical protein